jgi:hypothetical protein
MRRTPTLTKRVREIAEAHLIEHRSWPWSFDRVFEETGLEPSQIRDAIFGEGADEWRRGAIARFMETDTCRT